MLRRSLAILALGTALILSPAASFAAAPKAAAPASAFTEKQRAELNDLIKSYINAHPEVLVSSVEAYYNKQAETKQAQEGTMQQNPADLVDANTPFVGPKDSKVLVVEFFDYNCGYCKQVAGDVERLLSEDKTIKFAYKELPILSQSSEVASRYALAANKQGKYLAFHNAVMDHQGPINEDYLVATAKSVGLDVDKLKKDANSQDVKDILSKNLDQARILGVRGTPFFVIGKEKVPGAIGYTNLKSMIAKERGEAPAAPSSFDTPATKSDSAPAAATDSAPSAATSSGSPEVDAEIAKAKAEAQASLDELKAEAEKIRKDALEQQAKYQAAADAEAAKQKSGEAAKAKADSKPAAK